MLLTNPPRGYSPVSAPAAAAAGAPAKRPARDFSPSQILRTPTFYLLWVLFFVGSGAGLMVIGSVAGMAKKSLGAMAFVAVAIMAVGNAAGRIAAGLLSDRIGRSRTLFIMMGAQAALMFVAIPVVSSGATSPIVLVLLATFIGFNYGTNLSLFPSFAKDLWGLKNFGTNYGVLFSAWGVGGFVMGRVSEMLQARSGGSFDSCFTIAGLCLIMAAALALKVKTREQLDAEEAALAPHPAVQKA
jgi:nitrate/nitrite transporter NarK